MNENDDMKDFASYIEARARKKHAEAKSSATAGRPITEEENLFNATLGLRIKCGVCGATHKSSRVDILPGLKVCINKLVATIKEEERKSYHSDGKLYAQWTDEWKALKLRASTTNVIDKMRPDNAVWLATHRKFIAKVDAVVERVNETLVRDINGDVPMEEILGAPSSVEYVRLKLKDFKVRTEQEQADSHAKQVEMAGVIGKTLREWRTLPPETWKVGEKENLYGYDENSGVALPVGYLTINKDRISAESLQRCFPTVSTYGILWQAKPKEIQEYMIDVGLWKDGMPALLWTARAQQGFKHRTRRSRMTKHGKPVYGITFISTWSGKVYIMHGTPKTVESAIQTQRHEIVLKKEDKGEETS